MELLSPPLSGQSLTTSLPGAAELLSVLPGGQTLDTPGSWVPYYPVPVTIAASGTGAAVLAVAVHITIDATGSGTSAVAPVGAVTIAASGVGTSVVAGVEQYLATLDASGSGAAVVDAAQRVTADASGSGTAVVTAGAGAAAVADGSGTAVVAPIAAVAIAASGAGTSIVAPVAGVTADASGSGTAAVEAAAQLTLTATGSGEATVSAAALVTIDATGTGTAVVESAAAVEIQASGSGEATVGGMRTEMEASGSGTAVVSGTELMPGDIQATGAGTAAVAPVAAVTNAASGSGTAAVAGAAAVTIAASGSGTASVAPAAAVTIAASGSGTSVVDAAPAVPTRVASNGAVFDASPSAPTSFTANYPSGSASGDLLVMQAHVSKGAAEAVSLRTANLTGGAVWNFIQQRDDSASQGVYMSYFWAIRGSETSVTITPTPTTNIRSIITTITTYEGGTVDNGMPVGDYDNGYLLTNNTTGIACPALTTVLNNTEVLLFSTSSNATDTALTTTWTNADAEIIDSREWVSAQSSNFQHSAAYDVRPTAGATTTYTATPSATSAGKVAAGCVIQPAVTTFPHLVSYLTDFADANGTSTDITLPSADTGDLLLVFFQADGSQTTIGTSSSGWTKVGQYSNGSNNTSALFAGIQGTAAALTITNTTSLHRAWTVRTIKDWSGTIADIEVASTTGSSTNINPPTLTPSHGSQNYLWGVFGVGSQNSTYPTLPPAAWGNFASVRCNSSAGSTHIGHADAWTLAAGSSMDPPAFTSTTGAWLALTVAVL